MNKRAKRGAYRKPEEKRNNKITILLTGDELSKIERERKANAQCRSSFIRDSLIKGMNSPGVSKHKGDECEEEIKDGFGGVWSAWCCICGKKSMQVCRPGKVQCNNCD